MKKTIEIDPELLTNHDLIKATIRAEQDYKYYKDAERHCAGITTGQYYMKFIKLSELCTKRGLNPYKHAGADEIPNFWEIKKRENND